MLLTEDTLCIKIYKQAASKRMKKRYIMQTATTSKPEWLNQYQTKQTFKKKMLIEIKREIIKGSIQQEEITITNTYAPNNSTKTHKTNNGQKQREK